MSNNKRCRIDGSIRYASNCILETFAGRILLDQQQGLVAQDRSLTEFRHAVNTETPGVNRVIRGTHRMNDGAN